MAQLPTRCRLVSHDKPLGVASSTFQVLYILAFTCAGYVMYLQVILLNFFKPQTSGMRCNVMAGIPCAKNQSPLWRGIVWLSLLFSNLINCFQRAGLFRLTTCTCWQMQQCLQNSCEWPAFVVILWILNKPVPELPPTFGHFRWESWNFTILDGSPNPLSCKNSQ